MPDEITANPAPANAPVPQTPETPISTPPEAVIAPAPAEAPTEPVPTPEAVPEPSSVGINQLLGASGEASATRIEASPQSSISENINSQMGGNEPIEPAPVESIPPAPIVEIPAETPVAVAEPVSVETLTPEPVPAETTQPALTEPVIETVPEPTTVETLTPIQVPTEATPVTESADSRLGRRAETLLHLHKFLSPSLLKFQYLLQLLNQLPSLQHPSQHLHP